MLDDSIGGEALAEVNIVIADQLGLAQGSSEAQSDFLLEVRRDQDFVFIHLFDVGSVILIGDDLGVEVVHREFQEFFEVYCPQSERQIAKSEEFSNHSLQLYWAFN